MMLPLQSNILLLLASLIGFGPALLGQSKSVSPTLSQAISEGIPHVPEVLIFKIRADFEGFSPEQVETWTEIQARIGAQPIERLFPTLSAPKVATDQMGRPYADLSTIFELRFEESRVPMEEVLPLVSQLPWVAYAEPRYAAAPFLQPNDPYADTTGGLDRMWHLTPLMAREAWDIQPSGEGIRVGIVDSGTNGGHPDLQDNWKLNLDDPIDGFDNDGDGFADNLYGWDFGGNVTGGTGDPDPSIGNVHGLWVTGIVGATSNNQLGIPGLCMNCEYLPIKAAPDDDIGRIYYGYEGIVYAVEQGASVVNCSWGTPLRSRLGEDVVQYAVVNKQAAVVVAAGNSTSDRKFYPAAYEWTHSIANSHRGDTIFSNSTYNYTVDMTAPGGGIYSTFASNSYWAWSGTSASAPVAAAAIALTQAHFPEYSGFQAGERVRVTTDDTYAVNFPSTYQHKLGTGRVNMYRALTDPLKPSIRVRDFTLTNPSGRELILPGDTVSLSINWVNHLDSALDLRIRLLAPGFFQNFVELVADTLQIGAVSPQQAFGHETELRFVLSASIPFDFLLALRLEYTDLATSYRDFEIIEQRVNESYLNVTINDLHTTVNSQGNFGFNDFVVQEQGLGVRYQQTHNGLFEGGFLVGNGPTRVSDRIRNLSTRDNDFRLTEVMREIPSDRADFEATGSFDDQFALESLGIEVKHEVFAFEEEAYEDVVILQYVLSNVSGVPIQNVYAGLFADWDIYPFLAEGSRNVATYDLDHQLAYAYDASGNSTAHLGMSLLTDQTLHTRAGLASDTSLVSGGGKYTALSTAPDPTTGTAGQGNGTDIIQFLSGGPFSLFPSDKDTITFALIGGNSVNELLAHQEAAQEAYYCRVLGNQPSADFFVSQDTIDLGESLTFVDLNPNAIAWEWDLGDGTLASGNQVDHIFMEPGEYEVELLVSTEGCEESFTQTIFVKQFTSQDDPLSHTWQVFPNPFSKQLYIAGLPLEMTQWEVRLTDLLGREVYRTEFSHIQEGRIGLSVPTLPSGGYILQVHSIAWHSSKVLWKP
ncbi:MAG: S8 family serine peptidase [Bacteroidota bacterium]